MISLNSLSPDIHIQILQTDLHTFSKRIIKENLIKDQSISPLVILLSFLITFSLNYALILLREKGCWSQLIPTSRDVNGTSMPIPPDNVVYTKDSDPPGIRVAFWSDRTVSPT